MKRTLTIIGTCLLAICVCRPAFAQEDGAKPDEGGAAGEEKPGGDAAPVTDAAPPPSDDALKTGGAAKPTDAPVTTGVTATAPGEKLQSWKDIVVLPRKKMMKHGRAELTPIFATTLNDNLIQHYAIGGEFNYWLTDILSIGLGGMYYFKHVLDEEFFTRYHFGRVPSLNQYRYTVNLNFTYVPIYGKFALFNNHILHLEVFVTAGVGGTGTEIIPRDYQWEVFKNPFSLTFPVGAGARLFVTKWLAVQVAVRDYMMLDKFEPNGRGTWTTGCGSGQYALKDGGCTASEVDAAKSYGDTRFINNIMISFGLSFFLPTDFKYTTFR